MRGGLLADRIDPSSEHRHTPRRIMPTAGILMEAMAMSSNDFVTVIWYAIGK
jgi:hypothetical protein